jgi:type I restriction enzyme S subunit
MSRKELIPELRFPEFVNKKEWNEKSLGELYDFKVTNSLSREYLNYQKGTVRNIHYGDIHTKFSTLFDIEKEKVPFINPEVSIEKINPDFYCKEGDIVFADASEDLNDVGKSIEIINLHNQKLVSGLHTLLARQKKKRLAIGFGGYLFKSDSIRKQIQREAQGAKVLGISANRISNVKISYPENLKEQKKIASCLSSFDEVIAAQNQKLELLKEHKKGLMQNLFPQKGETVPKYRFKEFEKDGDWVEKKLGEVATFVNEKTSLENLSVNTYISTENLLSDYAGVVSSSKLPTSGNFTRYKEGDILISNIRPYLKKVWFSNKEGACSNDVFVVRANSEIIHVLLSFLLRNDDFINYIMIGAKGVKMPRGDKDLISKYPILFPNGKNEQQKIASTLSSLDALITAQAKKIEQLKWHKKGLMQGLFPKINH